jgi:hypothetical protein
MTTLWSDQANAVRLRLTCVSRIIPKKKDSAGSILSYFSWSDFGVRIDLLKDAPGRDSGAQNGDYSYDWIEP